MSAFASSTFLRLFSTVNSEHFLLVGAQKYFLPSGAGYPRNATKPAYHVDIIFFYVRTRCCTMLCVCHITTTQKLFCLHVFRQAGPGPPQRVDCLAPKWETALSVFPKDPATRYRIGSQTKVS